MHTFLYFSFMDDDWDFRKSTQLDRLRNYFLIVHNFIGLFASRWTYYHFWRTIFYSDSHFRGSKPSENHRVGDTYPCAGQLGNYCLDGHGHIDDCTIACLKAKLFCQAVRKLTNPLMKFFYRDWTFLSELNFTDYVTGLSIWYATESPSPCSRCLSSILWVMFILPSKNHRVKGYFDWSIIWFGNCDHSSYRALYLQKPSGSRKE